MAKYRLSRFAETDLMDIATYTLRVWGEAQTYHYIDDLESRCQQLADNPELGRLCEDIRPGLRRMEHQRHVVFYRSIDGGILVSRILHERMLPEKHRIDEDQ